MQGKSTRWPGVRQDCRWRVQIVQILILITGCTAEVLVSHEQDQLQTAIGCKLAIVYMFHTLIGAEIAVLSTHNRRSNDKICIYYKSISARVCMQM